MHYAKFQNDLTTLDATDFTKVEFKMSFKGIYHIATASSILEDVQVPAFAILIACIKSTFVV